MALHQASSFLVLLKSPLDTAESIQEAAGLSQLPATVADSSMIGDYLPAASDNASAALLDADGASALRDWAARHRAVYSLNMVPLDVSEARIIEQAAQKISWPIWVFLCGKLANVGDIAEVLKTPSSEISIKSASTLGYSTQLVQGAHVLRPIQDQPRSVMGLTTKLRPAQDVLNRLRHDANYAQSDYEVVYEDRFDGEIVLDLDLWKGDVSDDEFIPMHRILSFRRKWDGIVVWDRASRKDILFTDQPGSIVDGIAVELKSTDQASKLLASVPGLALRPCVISFSDEEGGFQNAYAPGRAQNI